MDFLKVQTKLIAAINSRITADEPIRVTGQELEAKSDFGVSIRRWLECFHPSASVIGATNGESFKPR